jgi:hypothetical protein
MTIFCYCCGGSFFTFLHRLHEAAAAATWHHVARARGLQDRGSLRTRSKVSFCVSRALATASNATHVRHARACATTPSRAHTRPSDRALNDRPVVRVRVQCVVPTPPLLSARASGCPQPWRWTASPRPYSSRPCPSSPSSGWRRSPHASTARHIDIDMAKAPQRNAHENTGKRTVTGRLRLLC